MGKVLALWGCVWLQERELEVTLACLLPLPLRSSLPPQSALYSAELARALCPLLQEAITLLAGLLLGRQAKKLLSGSHPAAMPTASTR